MVNWWSYYLSYGVVLLVSLTACQPQPHLYQKEISDSEKGILAEQLLNGLRFFYQGEVGEQLLMEEAISHQPQNATLYRELGAPAVKRGMAKDFYRYYEDAVRYDAVNWQGWRGYLYLYFYRDYERALADFQALDTLTPDFVDYPQATSVLFMSAICYLQLGQYDTAVAYFDRHIQEELRTVEEEYIDTETFLFKGIAYAKQGRWSEAAATFERGLRNADSKSADLWYWKAKAAAAQGNENTARLCIDAAKKWYDKGYFHDRPYVEEFYQLYRPQLDNFF
ncbi:MAG TPA: tetratricopeptide repeat protein [Phaeodactylibacter sp.]|nr:tetratricopeptide repeat protein [Phaeodactylibacter sp.]